MAWSVEKENKLIDLMRERSQVEANMPQFKTWSIKESWYMTLMKNMKEDEKQAMLDALLVDRRVVEEKLLIDKQAEIDSLNATITAEDTMKTP
jgi:hypothetical protein